MHYIIYMKIAIPSMSDVGPDSPVCDDLSHCSFYTILDVDGGDVLKTDIITNRIPSSLEDVSGAAIFRLAGMGIDAVIVKDIGEKERMTVAGNGIRVFTGASGNVSDAARGYLSGKLIERSEIHPCECAGGMIDK